MKVLYYSRLQRLNDIKYGRERLILEEAKL